MTLTNLSALAAMDRAHSLHPWTHFESFERDGPIVISRGEGLHLWDEAGNKYLDAVGGLWCTNIGLGRQDMADAISAQVMKLGFSSTFVDMTNDPAAALAGRLAALAPGDLDHVQFTTGGSTAIDAAYRMVQFYQSCRGKPEKNHVIARQHSYHGSTYVAMSIGMRNGDRAPEFGYKTDTIHHISGPEVYRRPKGMDVAAFCDHLVAEFEAKIAEIGAERIAAFFAEPIQASGGVLVPPEGYLKRMFDVCQANDILFVADEVVTAFGRLGHWFASWEVFGIQPDIICSAKGLSSGYLPIGAMIFSDRIWQVMSGDRWYTSGFTYSGHPVSCAAALKNIEIIENERLLDAAKRSGALFQAALAGLADLPIVGDVRGHTLIGCVENVADKGSGRLFDDEIDIGRRVSDAAEARGLFVRPIGPLNVMSPALTITEDQIGFIAETLRSAIVEVTDGLTREGVRIG